VRFLVDECTGPAVALWLKAQNYEVFSIYDLARGMDDDDIMKKAFEENWVLITNDKDFGDKIHRGRRPHRGVVLLRLADERATNKIRALQRLLQSYSDQLPDRFVVVTETRVRFAASTPT
jgi:predicted nuclease of predicted toxin-antitoxin system